MFDYIEINEDYSIYEIGVPDSWVGKSILDKKVRTKYNISILATKRGKEIYPLPHPDHVFSETESLMILGRNEDVKRLIK